MEEKEGGGGRGGRRRNYIRRWFNVSQRSCSCIFSLPSFPPTQNQQRCKSLSSQRLGVPLRLFTVSRGRTLTSWGAVGGDGVGWGGGGSVGHTVFAPVDWQPVLPAHICCFTSLCSPSAGPHSLPGAISPPNRQLPSVLHLPSALHLWYFIDVAAPFNYF